MAKEGKTALGLRAARTAGPAERSAAARKRYSNSHCLFLMAVLVPTGGPAGGGGGGGAQGGGGGGAALQGGGGAAAERTRARSPALVPPMQEEHGAFQGKNSFPISDIPGPASVQISCRPWRAPPRRSPCLRQAPAMA